MITVTVCDDSSFEIKRVSDAIQAYADKEHYKFAISKFNKQQQVIYELQDGKISDIYILDVEMPEKDGFELADEIRKYAPASVIMFLTSHDEMASKGYKSKALRYIAKINMENDFPEALSAAIKEIAKYGENTVIFRRYNDYWRIPYSDIVSVTRVGRQLMVSTSSFGDIYDNRGLTELFNSIGDSRFVFIDRCCFVNIDYIAHISDFAMVLTNGQTLPISRRALKNVKDALLENG